MDHFILNYGSAILALKNALIKAKFWLRFQVIGIVVWLMLYLIL